MTPGSRATFGALVMTGALIASFALSQTPEPEGHVTAIFHDVQVLPEQADARPAAINDKVDNGTALRTGVDSRSELTFADLTITRLGANTIFTFNKAGRSIRLDSGAILVYARKNSGGAEISSKAVSVGITGTTVIFESRADRYDRLIVLEGDTRCSLNNFPDQTTNVGAGQLLHVKAGAKKLPKPVRVDLRRIMKTHPLIKNFPPLPSLDLILAVADGRNLNRPPQPPIGGAGPPSGSPPTYVPNPTGPFTGPPPPPYPRYWRCINGQVVQMTKADCEQGIAQCYASEQEARSHCDGGGTLWCCVNGKVVRVSEAEARSKGIQCYPSEQEALKNCPSKRTCWCCLNAAGTKANVRAHAATGQVVETTTADCEKRSGQCYDSRDEALKNCRGAGPTPTPTLAPYRTYPTPRPIPTSTPSPYQPGGRVGRPNKPPTPTPTPKKRSPRIKRATPTPAPSASPKKATIR